MLEKRQISVSRENAKQRRPVAERRVRIPGLVSHRYPVMEREEAAREDPPAQLNREVASAMAKEAIVRFDDRERLAQRGQPFQPDLEDGRPLRRIDLRPTRPDHRTPRALEELVD